MTRLPVARLATLAAVVVLLTAAAGLRLRGFHPETRLDALLPASEDAAADYGHFLELFGGAERILVLVRSTAPAAKPARLIAASCSLAESLGDLAEIRRAACGLEERELEFVSRHVLPRAPLLLSGDWRRTILERTEPTAVAAQALRLRRQLTSVVSPPRQWLAADPLGLGDELLKGSGNRVLPIDPMTMAFLSADGTSALTILTPDLSELDADGGTRLLRLLGEATERVKASYGDDLEVDAVGGPLYAARDEAAFRSDLRRTLTTSAIGCLLVIALAFEGVLLPLTILGAMGLGLVWTGGALDWLLGSVTGLGLGFAAILLGLGVDVGIHSASRFQRGRRMGLDPMSSLIAAYRRAGPGVVSAAATTSAAFAALTLARLRPLRELGFGVAIGLLLTLLAAACLGPLLLVGSPRRRTWAPLWPLAENLVGTCLAFSGRHRRSILVATALLTVGTGLALGRTRIVADLAALRPTDVRRDAVEAVLAETFAMGLDTTHVLVPGVDLAEALGRSERAADLLDQATPGGSQIDRPSHWLGRPDSVEQRLSSPLFSRLGPTADLLEAELREVGLNPAAFASGLEALRALGRAEDPGIPSESEWPEWLQNGVRSVEGEGYWIDLAVHTPQGSWPTGPPESLLRDLDHSAPGTAVASAARLGAELKRVATNDLRRLGVLAICLVAALVAVSFRFDLRAAGLAVLPALLGTCWTLGGWALLGRPLGLLDVAVLPVLLGIGLDDGLHVLHGARRCGGDLRVALGEVGAPTVLTTATTAVGFGSLTLSTSRGLSEAGALVAVGVVACLAATLLTLPALQAQKSLP